MGKITRKIKSNFVMSYTNPTSTAPAEPISRNTFNFNVLQSDVDYENPLQIVDLKRVTKNPNFLCPPKNTESGAPNTDSEDSYKFLMIFADKTIPMGKKRAWITQLEKIGTKKRDLLKKFKTSIVALQENEAMKELSESRLNLLKEYCLNNDIDIENTVVENLSVSAKKQPVVEFGSPDRKKKSSGKSRQFMSSSKKMDKLNRKMDAENEKKRGGAFQDVETVEGSDEGSLLGKRNYKDIIADFLYNEFHEYMVKVKQMVTKSERVSKVLALEIIDSPLAFLDEYIDKLKAEGAM